jgi:hypothetical protein
MPVRTDRGRVVVYRKVWGWPLRSPRNLAVTVIVAVVFGVGIALFAAAVGATSATRPAVGAAASTPVPTATSSPATSDTSSTSGPAAPSSTPSAPSRTVTPPAPETAATGTDRATIVAREFMTRWVNHLPGMSSDQWVAQLTPYVVPEFVVLLESVDPTNIPATAVTGDPIVTAESSSVVEVDVPTNGGVVHLVLLAQPDQTWLVRSYDLAAS